MGATSSLISQPVAIVLMVLILGASVYMWQLGYLRSRAGLLTIGGILVMLGLLAFWSVPSAP